ncbi:MAG: phosphatidylinositol-specific phospholipase C/glycerophosphodiester phosphodiesterase family protein [Pseudomonadota bacterium]
MELIAHRRNTLTELSETPRHLGVEVDVRTQGDRLVIHHDPFEEGEDFDAWIAAYAHGTLILNVKEEGLETACLERMARRGLDQFFFLDQSFPFLMSTARTGEHRCAVRVSEYESVDTALTLAGQVDWVWVDCFTRLALTGTDHDRLRAAGFRLCLVSPELQGRDAAREIPAMAAQIAKDGLTFDAVCTKRPDLWEAQS